jgi:acetylornithine/succinyldiaminopimelate/putrescine aminotransferase
MCLNSGSEAVGLAARLSDIHANDNTKSGGPHAGKVSAYITMEGSFHGRVTQAAHLSHLCHDAYTAHLASFQPSRRPHVYVAKMNQCDTLVAAYREAEARGHFVEMVSIEPVMGEGVPGLAVTREFYDLARDLTLEKGSLLLMDSIQAGLRTTGCLSIVDYPGFQSAIPPDFETFSKALNGGQYPLSVLSLGPRAAGLYRHGTYGNTMTGNPRALDIGTAMIRQVTPKIRENVRSVGAALLAGLRRLQSKYPTIITSCEGLGLLLAANIDPKYPVVGAGGLEQQCRHAGLNIIHCGENALRFTPVLDMRVEEVQLCVDIVDEVLSRIHPK